jgi:hypothetical protein
VSATSVDTVFRAVLQVVGVQNAAKRFPIRSWNLCGNHRQKQNRENKTERGHSHLLMLDARKIEAKITLTQPLPGRERGFGRSDDGLNNASTTQRRQTARNRIGDVNQMRRWYQNNAGSMTRGL